MTIRAKCGDETCDRVQTFPTQEAAIDAGWCYLKLEATAAAKPIAIDSWFCPSHSATAGARMAEALEASDFTIRKSSRLHD